jgi:hypothetical protein
MINIMVTKLSLNVTGSGVTKLLSRIASRRKKKFFIAH